MSTRLSDAKELVYRADIDGLRAVAVIAVVGFHAMPGRLPGGFIGVDVFFVISGFLITGIIIAELTNGAFSLVTFYARRMRRILPALAVMLATVWAAGWAILLPEDFAGLGYHIAASGLFVSNLLSYSQAGYFDLPASTKPLLHLWSLGVEEQFYIAWPLLLLVAAKWRWSIPWLLVGVAVISFALNVAVVHADQSAAFYLPLTRFWELMAGGGLAYASLYRPQWMVRLNHDAVAVVGFVLIAMAALVTPEPAFPGWWAVPPVLGSTLLIAAGPSTLFNRTLLSWRPVVAIGLVSYPLYLWHWPVIVLARWQTALTGWPFVLTTTALSVSLAVATYILVERPVRFGRLQRIAAVSMAAILAMTVVGMATAQSDGMPGRFNPPLPPIFAAAPRPEYFPPGYQAGNVGGPKVLVWGDSNAAHLYPGLIAFRNEHPIRLYYKNWVACLTLRTPPAGQDKQTCAKAMKKLETEISDLAPDIVIVAGHWPQHDHIEGLAEPLNFLRRIGTKRILVIGTVPTWPQLPRKLLFDAYLAHPSLGLPDRLTQNIATDRQDRIVERIAKQFGAVYISPAESLCTNDGCLIRRGDNLTQFDQNHFTLSGSQYFIRQITPQILDALHVVRQRDAAQR